MSKPVEVKTKYKLKPNRYWVDRNGQVYWRDRAGTLKKMKPFTTRDGYTEYVLARVDGSKQHVQAQIIVLATFKGYPTDKTKTQVNHKDGKRGINKLSNLEWTTPKANIAHSFKKLGKVVWNSPNKK